MEFNFDQVFITGSTGWLGRQLIKNIINDDNKSLDIVKNKNLEVFAMIHPLEKDNVLTDISPSINIVAADLCEESDTQKFLNPAKDNSLLVHTAGVIHPKRVKDFYRVNYEGTKKLIISAEQKRLKKIIVISSNSPTGCNKTPNDIFTEESKYAPYMNYGKSKMMMEQFINEKINDGLDITIIRPPWFYGENMPERQRTFYDMVQKGKFPFVGNGENIRSVANVNNIIQGILLASIKEISKGKTYWIADDKNLTMKDIVKTVQNVMTNEFGLNCKKNRIFLPYFFGQIAQLLDHTIQFFGRYNQKIHVLSEMNKNIACDITKAKTELGYNPKIDFYEGTADALKEFYS